MDFSSLINRPSRLLKIAARRHQIISSWYLDAACRIVKVTKRETTSKCPYAKERLSYFIFRWEVIDPLHN